MRVNKFGINNVLEFESALNAYVKHMRKANIPEPVIQKRKGMIYWVCRSLNENGIEDMPQNWNETTVWFIGTKLLSTSPETIRKEYFEVLTDYASHFGNSVFEDLRCDTRVKEPKQTHKLTKESVRRIMSEAKGTERLVFHMAAYLGMGYTEIINLHLKNIYYDHFYIPNRNNSRGDMKLIVFHPETRNELMDYLQTRESEIKQVKMHNKNAEVPDYVFIHYSKGAFLPYSVAALHYMMKKLSKRVGVDFDICTLKASNKRNTANIEHRYMNWHTHQKTLYTYETCGEDCSASNIDFLQAAVAEWHKGSRGKI